MLALTIAVAQLSVLRVFQAMLANKLWRKQPQSGELVQLATQVTRNLFARLVPELDAGEATCLLPLPDYTVTLLIADRIMHMPGVYLCSIN